MNQPLIVCDCTLISEFVIFTSVDMQVVCYYLRSKKKKVDLRKGYQVWVQVMMGSVGCNLNFKENIVPQWKQNTCLRK